MSTTHHPLYAPAELGVPLLDGIDIRHGPRRELSQFFLLAERAAHEAGVYIRVQPDLSTLVAANRELQATWGPLVPILDPAQSSLSPENSFWLSSHDPSGRLVATYSARLLNVGPAGLADEFESLRIFYRDPGPHLARGTRCLVEGEMSEVGPAIIGDVTYVGGTWIDPGHRGKGLPYLLARIGRYMAMTIWDSQFTVSALRVNLAKKGVLADYGYKHLCTGIRMINSYRGDFDLCLAWMDRAWMEQEACEYVAAHGQKIKLGTAVEETTISPLERQGSSSLR